MFQINNALIFGKFLNLFGHGTTFCDAQISYKKEAKIRIFRLGISFNTICDKNNLLKQ